jgi:replicative DNA helicase
MELFNLEAEAAILGTVILNNEYLKRVEFLKPEYFYDAGHQAIFSKILESLDEKMVANQVTLKQFFNSNGFILQLGGVGYLSNLLAAASMIIDIKDYGLVIFELFKKRKIQEMLESKKSSEIVSELESLNENFQEGSFGTLTDFAFLALQGKDTLIKTHFEKVDDFFKGFTAGSLIVIAGRPSSGKTTFSTSLALSASKKFAETNELLAFFSLEVTGIEIANKILANACSRNSFELKYKDFSQDEIERMLYPDKNGIGNYRMLIWEAGGMTPKKIRKSLLKLVKSGLKIVFIDHLGYIKSDRKFQNKVLEVDDIMKELKMIAKELKIVIFVLSQLSRALESRTNHRPLLSDLRDSGGIEQEADIVMFVHREEYYLEKLKPWRADELAEWQNQMNQVRDQAQIIIAKNRNGETGEIELFFDKKFSRFI